jgi:hypothetical protein
LRGSYGRKISRVDPGKIRTTWMLVRKISPKTPRPVLTDVKSHLAVSLYIGVFYISLDFNIFRDSLRNTSEALLRTLQENLPEMNLKEIEEEETRRMTEGEDNDDDDEEVLPLDFRTALIEHENKVVI